MCGIGLDEVEQEEGVLMGGLVGTSVASPVQIPLCFYAKSPPGASGFLLSHVLIGVSKLPVVHDWVCVPSDGLASHLRCTVWDRLQATCEFVQDKWLGDGCRGGCLFT